MIDRFHIKSLFFLVLTIAAFVVSIVFQANPLFMPWLFLLGFLLLLLSVVFFSVEDVTNKERAGGSA